MISAETIVLNRLRGLQRLPQVPDVVRLMDDLARSFLDSSRDATTARRRAHALLRIAAGAVE